MLFNLTNLLLKKLPEALDPPGSAASDIFCYKK